jgi:hypothetical protein
MERNVQITFDTTTITDDEVRGIFALLDTVRPAAFDPGGEVHTALSEPVKGFNEWTGVQITKRADTGEEVSREPVSTFDGEEFPQSPVPPTTDANGLPWDERIHAGSKALNADGTWRTKRGVDKALVAEVEVELRGTEDVDNADYSDEVTEPVAPPAPPAPPAPTPSAPSPEPSAPTPASPFVALMKRVTTAQGAGKLTAQRVKELLESLDKKSIMDLRTDTDALDAFAVLLDGEGV